MSFLSWLTSAAGNSIVAAVFPLMMSSEALSAGEKLSSSSLLSPPYRTGKCSGAINLVMGVEENTKKEMELITQETKQTG